MDAKALNEMNRLTLIAERIKEMRDILGYTPEQMAEKTEVSVGEYLEYEAGKTDLPFTFLHKCSIALGIQLTELLEGSSAHLSSYTVTRKGKAKTPPRRTESRFRIWRRISRKKSASRIM